MKVCLTSPYIGVLHANWTSNSIVDLTADLHEQVFVADTIINSSYVVAISSLGNSLVLDIADTEHIHKICGVASGSACIHTEVAAHTDSDVITYRQVDKTFTAEQIKTLLDAGGNFYFRHNVSVAFENKVVISPTNPLNICLNGTSITNLYFDKLGAKVTITNCSSGMSTMTLQGNANFNSTNMQIFGLSKNITIESRVLNYGGSNNLNTLDAFDIVFNYYLMTDGTTSPNEYAAFASKMTFENCEFLNNKNGNMFYKNNGSIIVKDCSFHDMNLGRNLFASADGANYKTNWYMKGQNLFDSITVGRRLFVYSSSSGGDFVVVDGETTISNISVTDAYETEGLLTYNIESSDGEFRIAPDAKLNIINNTIKRYNRSVQSFLYANKSLNILGSLNITGNQFTNAEAYTGVLAGLFISQDNVQINVGSGSIIVKDNTSDGDESTNVNAHVIQVYTTNKSTNAIKIVDGYKFDLRNSEFGFAFRQSPYYGTIFSNFDAEHIKDFSDDIDIESIITADKTHLAVAEIMVSGTDVVVTNIIHKHKDCGLISGQLCTHMENDGNPYDRDHIYTYTLLSTDLEEARAQLLKGGNFVLQSDLSFDEVVNVSTSSDVRVCLYGYSLKNVVFTGGGNAFITNCLKNTKKSFEVDTDDTVFDKSVFIYSYDNISIKADSIVSDNSYKDIYMMNTTIEGTRNSSKTLFSLASNSNVIRDSVSLKSFEKTKSLIENRGTINVYNPITIQDITLSSAMINNHGIVNIKNGITIQNVTSPNSVIENNGEFNISSGMSIESSTLNSSVVKNNGQFSLLSGNLGISSNTVESNSLFNNGLQSKFSSSAGTNVNITSNTIKKVSGDVSIFDVKNSDIKILGNLTIKSNSLTNTSSVTGEGINAALRIYQNGSITIGNSTINVFANTTDASDLQDINKYLFQVYSDNTNGFIKQTSGTKFAISKSRMDVAFSDGIYEGTIYKNFSSSTVDDTNPDFAWLFGFELFYSLDRIGYTLKVTKSDDGVNVCGGNDQSAFNRAGANSFTSSSNGKLIITGGEIFVDSTGDGLDSNGSIEMSGGNVVVSGPTQNGNGPLDYDASFNITGGSLIIYGSNGMWQSTSNTSTQYSVVFAVSGKSGDKLELKDSSGNTVLSTTTNKTYAQILFSSNSIKKGETYTLYVNGTQNASLTANSVVTSNGTTGMGGGMQGDMQQGERMRR